MNKIALLLTTVFVAGNGFCMDNNGLCLEHEDVARIAMPDLIPPAIIANLANLNTVEPLVNNDIYNNGLAEEESKDLTD